MLPQIVLHFVIKVSCAELPIIIKNTGANIDASKNTGANKNAGTNENVAKNANVNVDTITNAGANKYRHKFFSGAISSGEEKNRLNLTAQVDRRKFCVAESGATLRCKCASLF